MNELSTYARHTVESLRLEAHPEGGYFRRTWTAGRSVVLERGERALASAIYFLLDRGQTAAWHVVASDELWTWHGPGELAIYLGGQGEHPDENAEPVTLGPSCGRFHLLVPAGTWQKSVAVSEACLSTCVVSPEFRFDDWCLVTDSK